MPYNRDELKQYLKDAEGSESSAYSDSKGNPTIGVGAKLNSPDVPAILNKIAPDRDTQSLQLTPEEQDSLLDHQLDIRDQEFEKIRKADFPEAQLAPNEELALRALRFNSPELLGPNMRGHIKSGNKDEMVKEIMLRSNKEQDPGIQRRRLKSSEKAAGDNWGRITESLSDEERRHVWDILNKIQNENTKEQTLKEYEFLKPGPRFKGLK